MGQGGEALEGIQMGGHQRVVGGARAVAAPIVATGIAGHENPGQHQDRSQRRGAVAREGDPVPHPQPQGTGGVAREEHAGRAAGSGQSIAAAGHQGGVVRKRLVVLHRHRSQCLAGQCGGTGPDPVEGDRGGAVLHDRAVQRQSEVGRGARADVAIQSGIARSGQRAAGDVQGDIGACRIVAEPGLQHGVAHCRAVQRHADHQRDGHQHAEEADRHQAGPAGAAADGKADGRDDAVHHRCPSVEGGGSTMIRPLSRRNTARSVIPAACR